MNMRMPGLLLLVVAFGCAPPPQGQDDPGRAEAELETSIDAWASAYERGDADAVAQLYAVDGIYAANTGEVLTGREAIRDGVAAWIAQRPPDVQLALETDPVRLRVAGDDAHALVRFVIRAVQGDCTIDAGHALIVWDAQEDGAWLIAMQVVNRDPEPPADACRRL